MPSKLTNVTIYVCLDILVTKCLEYLNFHSGDDNVIQSNARSIHYDSITELTTVEYCTTKTTINYYIIILISFLSTL